MRMHPSYTHLAVPPNQSGHSPTLERSGSEWVDTSAVFSPSVLSLYPDVSPHPSAVAYGVGYGELVAFLSGPGLKRHAERTADPAYVGFPEGGTANWDPAARRWATG